MHRFTAAGRALAALALLAPAAQASAQEVTLRAANAFQEGTYYARNFERFIKRVNEEGKVPQSALGFVMPEVIAHPLRQGVSLNKHHQGHYVGQEDKMLLIHTIM